MDNYPLPEDIKSRMLFIDLIESNDKVGEFTGVRSHETSWTIYNDELLFKAFLKKFKDIFKPKYQLSDQLIITTFPGCYIL